MQAYLISLGIGLGVGVLYALLNTRSPAPPVIALLGLLGMLIGETLTTWAKSRMTTEQAAAQCLHTKCFKPGEAVNTQAAPVTKDPAA